MSSLVQHTSDMSSSKCRLARSMTSSSPSGFPNGRAYCGRRYKLRPCANNTEDFTRHADESLAVARIARAASRNPPRAANPLHTRRLSAAPRPKAFRCSRRRFVLHTPAIRTNAAKLNTLLFPASRYLKCQMAAGVFRRSVRSGLSYRSEAGDGLRSTRTFSNCAAALRKATILNPSYRLTKRRTTGPKIGLM
jgi:hypothetical protein